jgi:hypothetical protein
LTASYGSSGERPTSWAVGGSYGRAFNTPTGDSQMNGIIYIIGLIVVIVAVLSFFGLG